MTSVLPGRPAERQLRGLSSEEARLRLQKYGPNAVAEEKPRLWLILLAKFWAPVPWMLEATIVLELILGKSFEAAIIGALLVFNAALSFFQENRANTALSLLRKQLAIEARVMRDTEWRLLPAEDLVPGDVVYLRAGDLVPADIRLVEGNLQLDQSALTGESLPVEAGAEAVAYAGATVKRGEAAGEIIATGARTYFGKTAELVGAAKTASHLETIIFSIVRYLVAMDGTLVAILLAYCAVVGLPFSDVLPFALILLVASVPVALPATFTLATSLGALELAKRGVLATRLSAIEEAAAMDVLCSDKTGTITQNRLALVSTRCYPPFSEHDLLRFAAYASDDATQDPIDLAILSRAKELGLADHRPERLKFIPFDPATKLAEAILRQDRGVIHALKGAPQAVAARTGPGVEPSGDIEQLAAGGCRVLAVAAGPENALRIAGLLALEDPPRDDSKSLVQSLRDLGVRIVMITGDGLATARAIAARVGIGNRACSARDLARKSAARVLDYDVFAEVFPEDKFRLVQTLQRAEHVVGMTGDGVNDAPALKQAEVGIAVASAVDVAKAAASLVLTNAGLMDVVTAVESSRRIYQRMLTYTLNKIIKTVEIAFFLSIGAIATRELIITPALIVLLLFTNDFVTMSIATDRVFFSRNPDRWHIRTLMAAGMAMGCFILMLSFGVFWMGRAWFSLPLPQLQTLVFITLVFTGQGTVYLVRERRHFWSSLPSRWLLTASILDVIAVSILASEGILMARLEVIMVMMVVVLCAVYLALLDFLKVAILRRLHYSG
jgi:H+-transporting ATPase